MRSFSRAKCAILGAALVASAASATTTFYVDPAGDDLSADGTMAAPYASLDAAYTAISELVTDDEPGVIRLAAGTYSLLGATHLVKSSYYAHYLDITNAVTITAAEGVAREAVILKSQLIDANTSGNSAGLAPGKGYGMVIGLSHEQACLSGVTVTGGKIDIFPNNADLFPGGVWIAAGTVENCVIRDNTGSKLAGNVYMTGGKLVDSLITGGFANRSNNVGGNGAGIRITGANANAVVERCVISENNSGSGNGAGIFMSSASSVVRDCVMTQNKGNSGSTRGMGIYLENGLVERCRIIDNVFAGGTARFGGGAYITGGTMRNCLIAENRASEEGGGAYITGGTLQYCTVANNSSDGQSSGGIYQSGGTVQNCISAENDPGSSADTRNLKRTNGTFNYNCVFPASVVPNGSTGNIVNGTPLVSVANGNYTLPPASAAIDAATPIEGIEVDLAGNARPSDGDGDGIVAPDMGCYEALGASEGDLRCGFSQSLTRAALADASATLTGTFAANASGVGSDGELEYHWTIEKLGASPETITTTIPQLSYDFGIGTYNVSLTVSNAAQGLTSEPFVINKAVHISGRVAYVSHEGSDTSPYDTWEKATPNPEAAVNALVADSDSSGRNVVIVADGTYNIPSLSLVITTPIEMRSVNGPETTILRAWNNNMPDGVNSKKQILNVNHPDAFIHGFSLTGAYVGYNSGAGEIPGALDLVSGTVSNCWIYRNQGHNLGGGARVSGGLLTHCEIWENDGGRNTANVGAGKGGGVYASGGITEFCTIRNNACANGGGVQVAGAGAIVRDCLIKDNMTRATNNRGVGVYISAGLVERCRIIGNGRNGKITFPGNNTAAFPVESGGVEITGGILNNCLIYGENTASGVGAAIKQTGGYVLNNTVYGNRSTNVRGGGIQINGNSSVTIGNIFYNNDDNNGDACNIVCTSAKLVDYNCVYPLIPANAAVGTHNFVADPLFVNAQAEEADFSLLAASPCIDSGISVAALAEAYPAIFTSAVLSSQPFVNATFESDFVGTSRALQGRASSEDAFPDVGAFEADDYRNGAMSASISATPNEAVQEIEVGGDFTDESTQVPVTLTATVTGRGNDSENLRFVWKFTDAAGNVFATSDEIIGERTYTRKFPLGVYDVSLTVTNPDFDNDTVEVEAPALISIVAPFAFVVQGDGNHVPVPPYCTWETAATNLSDALLAVGASNERRGEVVVADGTYYVDGEWLAITRNIELRSVNGPAVTVIHADTKRSTNRRVLNVNHPGAIINGFGITGGTYREGYTNDNQGPGGIRVNAGTVTNCWIYGNSGGDLGAGVDVRAGALVTDSVVSNNCAYRNSNFGSHAGSGGGAIMYGGTIRNTLFVNNSVTGSGGAITFFEGASLVTNCVFTGQQGGLVNNHNMVGGVFYSRDNSRATVVNCVIADNFCREPSGSNRNVQGGVAFVASSATLTLRNSLIRGSQIGEPKSGATVSGTALYLSGETTVENCTIANCTPGELAEGVYVANAGTTFLNNIIWNCGTQDVKLSSDSLAPTFAVNCFGNAASFTGATFTGNSDANPKLNAEGNLRGNSPYRNKAAVLPWMEGATDILGNPRIADGAPDLGCFESLNYPGTIFILR